MEYDSLKLLNMDGKVIGSCRLLRKPNTAEKETEGKKKEEATTEGQSQTDEISELPKRQHENSQLDGEIDGTPPATAKKKPVMRIDEDLLFVNKRGKEVQIMMEPGQTIAVGSKDVQVHQTIFILGSIIHVFFKLVDPIDPQEFIDGTFFWKNAGGKEIRQRAVEVVQKTNALAKPQGAYVFLLLLSS